MVLAARSSDCQCPAARRSANIANTLLKAIADAPNAVTLGIASRTIESATKWGAERKIPKAYGTYREPESTPQCLDWMIASVASPHPSSLARV
jgi:predicted dehydrogenase